MAHYRLNGKCVGTYESCSTSAFKHGRTETVRPCTTATHTVCKQLFERGSSATVQDIQNSIRECSNMHNRLTKEAAMGRQHSGVGGGAGCGSGYGGSLWWWWYLLFEMTSDTSAVSIVVSVWDYWRFLSVEVSKFSNQKHYNSKPVSLQLMLSKLVPDVAIMCET